MVTNTKALEKVKKELEKAEKLERELGFLTEKLARILQEPASRRDACHLSDSWSEIARSRPQMRAMGNKLRKIKKPVRIGMMRLDYRAHCRVYKRARAFMGRLWLWDEVEQIIHRHLEPERQPLLPKLQRTRQDDLLTQLYTALHRLANPNRQDSTALDHGCFPDIPMPIQSFELLMSAAYRISHVLRPRRALRFLDIGCGGGTKVLAATRFFEQTDGLEYDQIYADSARRTIQIIGKPNSAIFHADALTFDSYSDYDVIYCYRPLRTDALLETLERRIIRQARPGTILIAPYTVLQSPRDNKIFCRPGIDCAKVEGPLFVTGIEQADADQVRLDAEATSTEILVRSTDRDLDTGYWAPILDAASFNAAG